MKFMAHSKLHEIQISMYIKKFYWNTAMPFIYVLFMVAFALQTAQLSSCDTDHIAHKT